MTFNPVAALNVLECRNIIPTKNASAIDLGSQTSSINFYQKFNQSKQTLNC